MAGASLLALIDDIASVLDDVALLTKAATKKTAGVLGDDLALNAQQVTGVSPQRELPVVWAVAKGSLWNKAILVPLALLISGFAPWAVTPLLMIGGAFLCYEGMEKLAHRFVYRNDEAAARHDEVSRKLADLALDPVAFEKDKINGAIRTDFVLSAEIIAITLGTVATAAFGIRVAVLVGIALLMTVGVYGFVAGIVKLADAGHRGHVPGRWRHPHARRAAARSRDRCAGRGRRRAAAGGAGAGADADGARRAGRRRGRHCGAARRWHAEPFARAALSPSAYRMR